MQDLIILFNSQAKALANKWRVGPVDRDTQVGRPTCQSRSTDPHDSVNRHRRPGLPTARPRSTVHQISVDRFRSVTPVHPSIVKQGEVQ